MKSWIFISNMLRNRSSSHNILLWLALFYCKLNPLWSKSFEPFLLSPAILVCTFMVDLTWWENWVTLDTFKYKNYRNKHVLSISFSFRNENSLSKNITIIIYYFLVSRLYLSIAFNWTNLTENSYNLNHMPLTIHIVHFLYLQLRCIKTSTRGHFVAWLHYLLTFLLKIPQNHKNSYIF